MNSINIVGPINNFGYGTHTKNMIKAFEAIDISVSLETKGQIVREENFDIIETAISREFKENNNTLHIFHSEYLEEYTGKNLIPFVVFETTKLKPDVLTKISEYGNMLFTTTKAHKRILESYNLNKPIHVINEGVDPNLYNTEKVSKLIETNKYTYLLVGKNETRKNTNKVMTAFIQSMQYKNVALICHTYNFLHGATEHYKNWYNINLLTLGYKYIEETDYHIKFSNSFSDIYYTKPILDSTQMKSLYHSANVGISCSSAEGWGLPEMEMMACGVPVIISNSIGHSEYLKNIPVYTDLIIEPNGSEIAFDKIHFLGNVGEWSVINISDISEKLEYTYNNNIGQELSQELSNYIIKNYNWNDIAKQIKNILLGVNDEK